ncbi:type II toxin-antitoxin system RelE/ParE family toxin [Candidatus Peregrinibacteria bacterium]|nr:type II toxin-antitoxin system RelE/ParE family toxin [Candidatus Peregrinibacteria bacterium]
MYQILYTQSARSDLKKLNVDAIKRILKKIVFFSTQKDPLVFARKLKNHAIGQYRFRIGDYRAIFDMDKNNRIQILIILRIKHRKDVYEL